MSEAEHEHWMNEALREGQRGIGLTAPNPPVGAVIVRNGKELARGWHQRAGTAHAEKDALQKISDACGATLYVTLEPCSTPGRTGACTEAIIAAKIKTVVYGAQDPNPAHAGRARDVLEREGIEVVTGICREDCEDLIQAFRKVQQTGLPWIIAKTAMSLDGRVTRPKGEGQWLTGPAAREHVQKLRAEVDAIVTSGETVRLDNPSLTLRSPHISPQKKQPLRVVLTQKGLETDQFALFTDGGPTRLFQEKEPVEVLRELVKEHDVHVILLECGGRLMGRFFDDGLIDEMVIYLAPMVTGGPSPALGGEGIAELLERHGLEKISLEQIEGDLCLRGQVTQNPNPLSR